MMFWAITIAVLVLGLAVAWLADRRHLSHRPRSAVDVARDHDRSFAHRYAEPASPRGTQVG